MIIKAVTLHQPWATFMALGLKKFETRSWSTDYRGWLAIHAGKTWDDALFHIQAYHDLLLAHGYRSPDDLPFGKVLSVGRLTNIYKTEKVVNLISAQERVLGNYSPGRYAWETSGMIQLPEPIPARGMPGLWGWEMPQKLIDSGTVFQG